ncbi:MAG: ATP-binding protein [Kofleriaceae bacterium]
MRALVLERNKLVGRRVLRHFAAAGIEATLVEDPAGVPIAAAGAALVCADAFDGDAVVAAVRANPGARGLLWTAEPLKRALRFMAECPQLMHVFGRKDFESPPRGWELMMVLRRLRDGGAPPPLTAFVDWGHTGFEAAVATSAERDAAAARVQDFVAALGVPKRLAEMASELVHELLMNALYDAPVDAHGAPRYAGDRKATVALPPEDAARLRCATDGTRVVVAVRDRFGGLARRHVVDGLARGLAGGEMDHSHGGAGLGMTVCHHNALAMFFDVARGRHTEVTALLELDLNLREVRTQARSLHLFGELA